MKNLNAIIDNCLSKDHQAQQQLYNFVYTNLVTAVAVYARDNSNKDWIFNLGMMRIFNSLHKFKKGTNLLGWARTILVRTAIDHIRSDKNYKAHLSPVEIENYQKSSTDFEEMMDRIDTDSIITILQQLPENQKLVFNMYELEGYGHKEIQSITGMNYNTSKWLLAKAKKTLRQIVSKSKDLKHHKNG